MPARKPRMPDEAEFFASIGALLAAVEQPPPKRTRKPGRPRTRSAEVCPLVLHLYRQQVAWLDAYADVLASYEPGNKRLKRVEIIRALLLGLAEHIYRHRVRLPEPIVIRSERDLQKAIAAALERARG